MSKEHKVDGRKLPSAWPPERRARFSAYKKAHPTGNRDPAWWAANPQQRAKALARLKAGHERKSQEASEADGADAV